MNKKFLLIIFIGIFLISFSSATCTISLNKDTYYSGETVTATMSCSAVGEKSQSWNVTWNNGTANVWSTAGTTPATATQNFFSTYSIPLNSNWTNANATLKVIGINYTDYFNVSLVNNNGLIVNNVQSTSDAFLGKDYGISFVVKDKNGLKVNNAVCRVRITSGNTIPLVTIDSAMAYTTTIDGVGSVSFRLMQEAFEEGYSYTANIRCECPLNNSNQNYCYDENSVPVYASYGYNQYPFTTNKWLNINTLTDSSNYIQKEEIFICANVTNLYTQNYSIFTKLNYNVRCSSGLDNFYDLDRAIVISDDGIPDLRGIPYQSTRMQCKRFVTPESRYLQGKTSQCFASSYVSVIYETGEIQKSYRTDSPYFNITLDDLNIQPDWQQQTAYQWNSIVNLSSNSYQDYNGTKESGHNLDLRLDKVTSYIRSYEQDSLPEIEFNNFILGRYIKNYSVYNCSNNYVPNSQIEFNDDGNLELEVRNADISPTGCYNITLQLASFEERQASSEENQVTFLNGINTSLYNSSSSLNDISKNIFLSKNFMSTINDSYYLSRIALETIANKTGTFAFSISVPSSIIRGTQVPVRTFAQVEFGEPNIEGHFICYIEGMQEATEIRWTHAITSTVYEDIHKISLPELIDGNYIVKCKLGEAGFDNPYHVASQSFSFGNIPKSPGGSGDTIQISNLKYIDVLFNDVWDVEDEEEIFVKTFDQNDNLFNVDFIYFNFTDSIVSSEISNKDKGIYLKKFIPKEIGNYTIEIFVKQFDYVISRKINIEVRNLNFKDKAEIEINKAKRKISYFFDNISENEKKYFIISFIFLLFLFVLIICFYYIYKKKP